MKFKIIIGTFITGIAIITFIAKASRSDISSNPIESSTKNSSETEQIAVPQLIESIATDLFKDKSDTDAANKNATEWHHQPINPNITKQELMGHLNKEYGIREDILRYIEKMIPPDNIVAKTAAIKYAQNLQFIYFKATPEEALKAAPLNTISLECLHQSIQDDQPISVAINIGKLMANTPERDKYMWQIDQTYFGWKVIHNPHIPKQKLKQMCETGNYEL